MDSNKKLAPGSDLFDPISPKQPTCDNLVIWWKCQNNIPEISLAGQDNCSTNLYERTNRYCNEESVFAHVKRLKGPKKLKLNWKKGKGAHILSFQENFAEEH